MPHFGTLTLQSPAPGWKLKALCYGRKIDKFIVIHPCGIQSHFKDLTNARKFARHNARKN